MKKENKEHYTPYELFNIECGEGWYKCIQPCLDYINDYNKDKSEDEQIYIFQIKEKWGELCFYTSFTTPELDKLIEQAEDECSKTCEICGSKDDVGMKTTGWLTTLCRNCMQEIKGNNKWKSYKDNKVYELTN